MLADDFKAHPWVFENVGLQLEDSAALLFEAVGSYDNAIAANGERTSDIRVQRDSIANLARAIRGKSLHFLETLASQDARLVGNDPGQWRIVINRLGGLLEKDVENQGRGSDAVQKLEQFQNDADKWLQENFSPMAYKSAASIDWNDYVPFANGRNNK